MQAISESVAPATEAQLEQSLADLLSECSDVYELESALAPERVRTFADAGVMTYNRGLVLGFANGAEYQVTIIQSREAS